MRSLPDNVLQRVNSKILQLEHNPFAMGVVKLKKGIGYRLRVGDWRVIYIIDSSKNMITIIGIKHRGKAYK